MARRPLDVSGLSQAGVKGYLTGSEQAAERHRLEAAQDFARSQKREEEEVYGPQREARALQRMLAGKSFEAALGEEKEIRQGEQELSGLNAVLGRDLGSARQLGLTQRSETPAEEPGLYETKETYQPLDVKGRGAGTAAKLISERLKAMDQAGRMEALETGRDTRLATLLAGRADVAAKERESREGIAASNLASRERAQAALFGHQAELQRLRLAWDREKTTITEKGKGARTSTMAGAASVAGKAVAAGNLLMEAQKQLELARQTMATFAPGQPGAKPGDAAYYENAAANARELESIIAEMKDFFTQTSQGGQNIMTGQPLGSEPRAPMPRAREVWERGPDGIPRRLQ